MDDPEHCNDLGMCIGNRLEVYWTLCLLLTVSVRHWHTHVLLPWRRSGLGADGGDRFVSMGQDSGEVYRGFTLRVTVIIQLFPVAGE